jgi:hypothetical protein
MFERRTTVAIDKQGSLYFLLNGFLGALNRAVDVWQRSYDRRTDVMEKTSGIDLEQLAAKLKVSTDELKAAIDKAS